MSDQTETKTKEKTPPDNIQFCGKVRRMNKETGKMQTVPAEPLREINSVSFPKTVKLPDAETQAKGFYHKDAELIKAEYPDYKTPTAKGAKS